MKYLITTTFIVLMAVGSASAQNMNIGVKGGLNSYTVENYNTDFDSKIGFHLGLMSHFHMGDQFGLQPELVYSMQGAKSGNTELLLDYINVPVLFQYMFDNGFRLHVGPQIGFLLNAEVDNNGSTLDLKNDFKPVDVALSFGASYVNPASGFGIDARYNLGITDITENSNFETTNRGIQIGVFYLFGHRN